MKRLVALTGAGISAESGLKTFRDSGGLWEGHDIMEVASPTGWLKNQSKVLDFYNQRRSQLSEVQPNDAHKALAKLQETFEVQIVTQNVDDLHERAGSLNVLHLHGELKKVRSTYDDSLIYDWNGDLSINDLCEKGHQLRPHIVWFGEMVPEMENAAQIVSSADILIIIGTSLQVYPAASLVAFAQNAEIFYIDPNPVGNFEINQHSYQSIPTTAIKGMKELVPHLIDTYQ